MNILAAQTPPRGPLSVPLELAAVLGVWGMVLALHLTPALFALLVVYGGTSALAVRLTRWRPHWPHPRGLALVILLGTLVLAVGIALESLLHEAKEGGGYAGLLRQMAASLESLRAGLPPWLAGILPLSLADLHQELIAWLRAHAEQVQLWGKHALHLVGYTLIGSVIGALMTVQLPAVAEAAGPSWVRRLRGGFEDLVGSFTSVVFAQVRISAINTLLTGVFVFGVMPLLGFALPLAGTVLVLVFCMGLLPIVGNLIGNTVIVVLSLKHGLSAAILALVWLVLIHKLEYLLNAQIIGSRIRAQAWELLLAMLLLEAMFGLAGLVSAPVVYAQVKQLLYARGLLDEVPGS